MTQKKITSWQKEQESYSQMISVEITELGETKLVLNKLKEQVK
jgi:hypothetical protein